jgi:hypothetical protein
MISIKKNPSILINGHKSNWFPAHQPITFEIQRIDASVIAKTFKNNQVTFTLNVNLPSSVKAGHKFSFVQGTKQTLLTIISASGNKLVVPYTSTTYYGVFGYVIFTDSYTSHFIETKVSYIKGSTYEAIGSIKNKTDLFGVAKISVQELLSTKCINQNDFLYNAINKHQFGEGSKFNIQIREVINGVAGNYTSLVDANVLYYTNSSNQIQDKYGYNMGSFVPTYDSARTDKAKFQSVFKRPTYFVNYPFSLNFIYSDNMLNYQVTRKEQTKDINGNIIATTTDNLNMASRLFANRLMLKQGYTSNIKTLDIWLESDVATVIPSTYEIDYASDWTVHYAVFPDYTKSLYE